MYCLWNRITINQIKLFKKSSTPFATITAYDYTSSQIVDSLGFPLILEDIAKKLKMHESTISRATTQKYLHTPKGIYELKYYSALRLIHRWAFQLELLLLKKCNLN